jgi:hypothetical protein
VNLTFNAIPHAILEGDGFRIWLECVTSCDHRGPVALYQRDLGVWPLCPDAARILAEKAAEEEADVWKALADKQIQTLLEVPN